MSLYRVGRLGNQLLDSFAVRAEQMGFDPGLPLGAPKGVAEIVLLHQDVGCARTAGVDSAEAIGSLEAGAQIANKT